MEEVAIPEGCIETGRITLVVYATPDSGSGTAFTKEGINNEQLLGMLTFLGDYLRVNNVQRWEHGSNRGDGFLEGDG